MLKHLRVWASWVQPKFHTSNLHLITRRKTAQDQSSRTEKNELSAGLPKRPRQHRGGGHAALSKARQGVRGEAPLFLGSSGRPLNLVGVEASSVPWLFCRLATLRARSVGGIRFILGQTFGRRLFLSSCDCLFYKPCPLEKLSTNILYQNHSNVYRHRSGGAATLHGHA